MGWRGGSYRIRRSIDKVRGLGRNAVSSVDGNCWQAASAIAATTGNNVTAFGIILSGAMRLETMISTTHHRADVGEA